MRNDQKITGAVTPNIIYRTEKSGLEHAPFLFSVVMLPDGREHEGESAATRKAAVKMAAARPPWLPFEEAARPGASHRATGRWRPRLMCERLFRPIA